MIRNDSTNAVVINVEPEGAFCPLEAGEEACVMERYDAAPLTLRLSTSPAGATVVSVWPGDGDVRIEVDGIDILERVAEPANVAG